MKRKVSKPGFKKVSLAEQLPLKCSCAWFITPCWRKQVILGGLPGVKDLINDPHGEIKTAVKKIIKKDSAKENKKRTNEGCINIKQAIYT